MYYVLAEKFVKYNNKSITTDHSSNKITVTHRAQRCIVHGDVVISSNKPAIYIWEFKLIKSDQMAIYFGITSNRKLIAHTPYQSIKHKHFHYYYDSEGYVTTGVLILQKVWKNHALDSQN